MLRALLTGAVAGAAGTTALHAATYLDMALRGRPASRTPEDSVERLVNHLPVDVPGAGAMRDNRVTGIGALLGVAVGVAAGAGYGALLSVAARRPRPLVGGPALGMGVMAATNAPLALLGVSDPRAWSRADWLSDVLPHLAYGVVAAATYEATQTPPAR